MLKENQLRQSAQKYFTEGEYQKAIDFSEIILHSGDDESMLEIQAKSFYCLRNYERTIECIINMPNSLKIDSTYLNLFGISHFHLGNYQKAADTFRLMLSFEPGDIGALTNISYSYLMQGKMKMCKDALKRAVLLNNIAEPVLYALAAYYDFTKNSRLYHKTLRKIMFHYPGNSENLTRLAKNYSSFRKYDSAAKYYERSLKINPDDAETYRNLACIYAFTESEPRLLDILLRAIAKGPKVIDGFFEENLICHLGLRKVELENILALSRDSGSERLGLRISNCFLRKKI